MALKYDKRISLSAQELVDCSFWFGNKGCDGGWMHYAFKYVQYQGIMRNDSYAYTDSQGICKKKLIIQGKFVGPQVLGYVIIDTNEVALLQALRKNRRYFIQRLPLYL